MLPGGPRQRSGARASAPRAWRQAGPRAGSWRPCRLATACGHELYRGASRRTHSPADLGRSGEAQCLSLLRAFKQSFGVPPHRYHIQRRIERAKMLLAKLAMLVAEVGVGMGFRVK